MTEDNIDSFVLSLSEFLDELDADNFEDDESYLPLLDFCRDKLKRFINNV